MAEPRLLQVGTEETIETVKGESGLSSAQVGTEAKVSVASEESAKGVYVANTNVVNNNAKSLSVSNDSPRGKYVQQTQVLGGFERSKGDKKIVDTITVDETKFLIKKSQKETKEYIDSVIELIREGQYVVVDTETYPTLEDFLESTGEQGTVYLYPLDNTGNNYDQYIWENGVWKNLGTTELDLSNYMTLDTDQTSTGVKTFSGGIKANSIEADSGVILIKRASNFLRITDSDTQSSRKFIPTTNNACDLGENGKQWKDGYFSGYLKGLTILTQAQYDALVSGGTVDADTFYFIEEE